MQSSPLEPLSKSQEQHFQTSPSHPKIYQDTYNKKSTPISDESPYCLFSYPNNSNTLKHSNIYFSLSELITSNNLDCLKQTLKNGIDPNVTNNRNESLLYLCVDIENYEALAILLQYDANCDIANNNGNTPLHLATNKQKENFICCLLEHGANANIPNKINSQTAMHLCIIKKSNEFVLNEFKNNGGDLFNIKDAYDKSPFDYAVNDEKYLKLVLSIFNDKDCKDYLLSNNNTNFNNNSNNNLNYSNFISLSKNIKITNDNDYNNYDNDNENQSEERVTVKEKNRIEIIDTTVDVKKRTPELNKINNNNENNNKCRIFNGILSTISNKKYSNSDKTTLHQKLLNKELINNIIRTTIKKVSITNSDLNSNLNLSSSSKNNTNSNINSNRSNSHRNNKIVQTSDSKKLRRDISDINPMDMINQIITTNNSNVFSELQINTNTNINENNNENNDNNNNEIHYTTTNNNNNNLLDMNDFSANFMLNETSKEEEYKTPRENENDEYSNSMLLNDSLEYSKSKSIIIVETPLQNNNSTNNKFNVIKNSDKSNIIKDNCYEKDSTSQNLSFPKKNIMKHRKQISYHNNSAKMSNNYFNNNNLVNANNTYSNKKSNYINNDKENISPNNIENSMQKKNSNIDNTNIMSTTNKNSTMYPITGRESTPSYNIIYKEKICYNNHKSIKPLSLMGDVEKSENDIKYSTFSNTQRQCDDNYNKTFYVGKSTYDTLFKKALRKKCLLEEITKSKNIKYNNIFPNTLSNNESNLEGKIENKISNELIVKLRDWLISCDLLCYYNLLIKHKIYDIQQYINNYKTKKINITFKDIEDIGIKKPGHVFRFLLKLQIDSDILDRNLCEFILNKFNTNLYNNTMNVNLTTLANNNNENNCCDLLMCCKGSFGRNSVDNYNDIFSFLRSKNLMNFRENFIHNGFDQIEFIIIQLFSEFQFNRDILNDYLHIYNEKDQTRVLSRLYEEKRKFAEEFGFEYDRSKEKEILNESILRSCEKSIKEVSESSCNIF